MRFASYTTNKNNDDIADKYDPHEAILLRIAKASGVNLKPLLGNPPPTPKNA